MEKKKKVSLLYQVAMLFIIGVILIGALSIVALYRFSTRYVMERLETSGTVRLRTLRASFTIIRRTSGSCVIGTSITTRWISSITQSTLTAHGPRRNMLFLELHPEFRLDYANTEEVEALSPEDQKLYAEIVYSWLIDRIDYIQLAYDLDYFFCVVTDEPYDRQFVLFIAADEGGERGPEPGQIYPIGKSIKVTGGDTGSDARSCFR